MSKGKLKSYSNPHPYHRRNMQQQQQRSFFLPIMLCSRSTINDVAKFSNHHYHYQSPSPTATATGVGCHPKKRNSSKVAGFPTTTTTHINSFSSAFKSLNLNDNNHRHHHHHHHNHLHYHRSTKPHLPSVTHTPAVPSFSTSKPSSGDHHHRSVSLDIVRSTGRDLTNNNTNTDSSSSSISISSDGKLASFATHGVDVGVIRGSGGGSLRRLRRQRELKPIDDVGSLDPPLPVVKKSAAGIVGGGAEEEEEERARDSLWKRRSGGMAPALRPLEIRPMPPSSSSSRVRSRGGCGAVAKTV